MMPSQRRDFALEQQACGRVVDVVRDALGGRVRAVRGAECVVDVEIGELAELRGELRVVLRLARFVARVLEQQHFAVVQSRDQRFDFRRRRAPAQAARRLSEQFAELRGHRRQRELRIAILRATEVRADDHLRAAVDAVARSSARSRRCARRRTRRSRRPASFSGALRSARTSTRLPATSGRCRGQSSCRRRAACSSGPLEDLLSELDHAVRVAPLVVVPGDDLDEVAVDHAGQQRVKDRGVRRVDDVAGDDRVIGVLQDACKRTGVGLGLDGGVDLFRGHVAAGLEGEVDD